MAISWTLSERMQAHPDQFDFSDIPSPAAACSGAQFGLDSLLGEFRPVVQGGCTFQVRAPRLRQQRRILEVAAQAERAEDPLAIVEALVTIAGEILFVAEAGVRRPARAEEIEEAFALEELRALIESVMCSGVTEGESSKKESSRTGA